MCFICACKLKIRFDLYIGEKAVAKYLIVSDPITMKKDRLHTYRILAKELLKSNKNANQGTTQPNSIKIVKPSTNENTPIKPTKKY